MTAAKPVAAKPVTKSQEAKFSLPGQKYATPEEGDGTRLFYESLLKQNKASTMAQKWCVDYGCLPQAQASTLAKKLAVKK